MVYVWCMFVVYPCERYTIYGTPKSEAWVTRVPTFALEAAAVFALVIILATRRQAHTADTEADAESAQHSKQD